MTGLPRPLEQGDKRAPRQACFGTPEPQGRQRIRFLLEKVDVQGPLSFADSPGMSVISRVTGPPARTAQPEGAT